MLAAGRIPEAVEQYNEVVRIQPNSAEAHNNLAVALAEQGRMEEAIPLGAALRLKPDYPEAQNGLARLLATLGPAEGGNPVRAVALAQRACELTGNSDATCLETLAAAYAAAGRFNDAIATAEKTIVLARSAGQSQLVEEIQAPAATVSQRTPMNSDKSRAGPRAACAPCQRRPAVRSYSDNACHRPFFIRKVGKRWTGST